MTLQQLKYVLAVSDKGSISEAAKSLYISQPSLSNAIKELEQEIGLTIFMRSNRGILLTNDGVEFLGYARQVIQQSDLLEEKYIKKHAVRQRFRVSTQRYAFTANAFVELVQEFGGDEYDFTLHETSTYEVIEEVRQLRSDLGVIYLSEFNEAVITRLLRESSIEYHPLLTVRPHVFLSRTHPLAKRSIITLEELDDYPRLSVEQGANSSFYFSEEILSTRSVKKSINVSDRAAIENLLIGIDAYSISTGIFPKHLHGEALVSVPLEVDERITLIVLKHRDTTLSTLGELYWAALKRFAEQIS